MSILRVTVLASFPALFAVASLAVACGSGSSGGSNQPSPSNDASSDVASGPTPEAGGGAEASSGDDAGTGEAGYPAVVPTDVPQVVSRGGPVMANPKVVPIFYATDDATSISKIEDFVAKLGTTQYWGVMSEYGVGAITSGTPIVLTHADDPPLVYDDADIETWLANKLNSNDPAFPQPDANTIYTFFFPADVTITQGGTSSGFPSDGGVEAGPVEAGAPSGSQSCVPGGFGGYHSVDQAVNSGNAVYAIVARCSNFDGYSGVDSATAIGSHELAESASDPLISAYSRTDTAHSYWSSVLGGGEIGDMCAQDQGSFTKFSDSPYLVQRLWSNKAAMAGTDPCVPVPAGEVYFNTYPNMPDTLQAQGRGPDGGTTTIPTKGVQIAVGSSKTIELDLFSTAPTAPWKIVAQDPYQLGLAATKELTLAPSITVGENGTKINLTITVVAAGRRNTEPFLITSTASDGTQHEWAGVVGQ